ncbi:unnamed protein product [Rotaria magnacalcarata]|uniref:Uncharacterized protein n=1 Tax=Rotaria magnacalcarata TaxID=392030 RepID=A0A815V497_9BILA|nr:unnamed protein product [Rotaria magnacalcarata]
MVLAYIIEIPKPFRENEQNSILLTLWHSPRPPTGHILLAKITQDLCYLIEHGISIYINDIGYIHFDVYVQAVCADGPGQSKVTEMTSYNGYFACRVCEFRGTYEARDGTCSYSWSSYIRTRPPFRTKDRFESCLKEVERLKTRGSQDINVFGLKGISPLNEIIFIPNQAVYDYFHLSLENVKDNDDESI